MPDNPEAWLLTAARRRLVDGARHASVSVAAEADLSLMLDGRASQNGDSTFPDQGEADPLIEL